MISSLTTPVQTCRHWLYLGAALVPGSSLFAITLLTSSRMLSS